MSRNLSSQFGAKTTPLAPSQREVSHAFAANTAASHVAGSEGAHYEGPQAGVGLNKNTFSSTAFNFNTKDIRPGHVQAHSKVTSTSIYGGAIGDQG